MTKGRNLQGLLAQNGDAQRACIVTIEPEMEDSQHAIWPRIAADLKLELPMYQYKTSYLTPIPSPFIRHTTRIRRQSEIGEAH